MRKRWFIFPNPARHFKKSIMRWSSIPSTRGFIFKRPPARATLPASSRLRSITSTRWRPRFADRLAAMLGHQDEACMLVRRVRTNPDFDAD